MSERERAFVGWRVARDDEQVMAWRNESPGSLRVSFRQGEFEDLDGAARGTLVAKGMTDAEFEAAKGQVLEDVAVAYWRELDRNLARLFGPLPPVEDN